MSNPIPIIENVFGEKLSSELLVRVRTLDVGLYERLLEAVKLFEVDRDKSIPAREEGELRPYFSSINPSVSSPMSGHYGLHEKSFETQDDIWSFCDRIKERLLYCHKIVLDDPLWLHADVLQNSCTYKPDSFFRRAELFANYLTFRMYFKPLIEQGTIQFVGLENSLVNSGRMGGELFPVEETLQQIGAQELLDEVGEPNDNGFLADVLVDQAFEHIHAVTKMARYVPDGVDYLLPRRYWEQIFKNYLVSIGSNTNIEQKKLEGAVLRRLIELELPKLEFLEPETIARIRMDGGDFDTLRAELRTVLMQVNRSENLDPADLRVLVADQMAKPVAALQESIRRSTFLSQFRSEVSTTLVVGSATQMMMSPMVGDDRATVLALTAVGLQTIAGAVNSTIHRQNYSSALEQHYIVLR